MKNSLELRYIESINQTLILKRTRAGSTYAAHWAGQPTEEEVKEAMRTGDVLYRAYNMATGEYLPCEHCERRFRD